MSRLRVMLEYFHPWPNSAGFYLARERGWYREADLDVELCVHDPERGDALAHLQRGEVDVAVFPSNRLLVRRDAGEPLLAIAAVNQTGLESIQTLRASGIRRARDLAGKRLALNPTPRGLAMVRHLVEADGGRFDEVQLVDAGSRELRPEQLLAGEADASFGGYWAWEALMSSAIAPEERVVLPVSDLGAPPYHSYQIGVQEAEAQRQPDRLRAFLQATVRGFEAVAADPSSALAAYERVTPYFPSELLTASLNAISSSWLHEGRFGLQRAELIEPYAAWLGQHGILRHPERWAQAYTNDLLPVRHGHAG